MKVIYETDRRPGVDEYIEFISRTDLCNQYPKARLHQRIQRLLENYDVGVTARDESRRLIGICLGVTDFAYYLLLTDIAVDRDLVQNGIGREMMSRLHELAGGAEDICVFADTHPDSKDFYVKCGFETCPVMYKEAKIWDLGDIRGSQQSPPR